MIEKLKVDKEVFQALEKVRKIHEYDAEHLIDLHSMEAKWKGSFESLNKLSAYEFSKAILIGYELDRTPEEKILNLYLDRTYNYDFHEGYKAGVKDSLNTFGITVKGINE